MKLSTQQRESPSVCWAPDSLQSAACSSSPLQMRSAATATTERHPSDAFTTNYFKYSPSPPTTVRFGSHRADRCRTWPLMKDSLLLKVTASPATVCAGEPPEEDVGTNPRVCSALSALVASDKIPATGSLISLPRSRVCFQISSLVYIVFASSCTRALPVETRIFD